VGNWISSYHVAHHLIPEEWNPETVVEVVGIAIIKVLITVLMKMQVS
jgi:hypothetical protein